MTDEQETNHAFARSLSNAGLANDCANCHYAPAIDCRCPKRKELGYAGQDEFWTLVNKTDACPFWEERRTDYIPPENKPWPFAPAGANLKLRGGLTAEQEKSDERKSNE